MFTNNYFSYLMRIWQDEDPHQEGWRASLEDPTTKQVVYFKTMEELFEFLNHKALSNKNKKIPLKNG